MQLTKLQPIGIAKIAKSADVSYATAWRVINKHPSASEAAIEAVRKVVQRQGYVHQPPPGRKRGRPRKAQDGVRTRNLAWLYLREAPLISTAVLKNVQHMLTAKGFNLIYGHVEQSEDIPQAVRTGNVDGMIGYGEMPDALITPALKRVPTVWLMTRADGRLDEWGDRVHVNHAAMGQAAAQLALRLGSQHLGVMNHNANHRVPTARCEEFTRVCEAAGCKVDLFESKGLTELDEQAQHLVELYLAAPDLPPVVFAPIDQITLRVHRLLQDRGIQPGRDVRLVSCDHEPTLMSLMDPPPASIELPSAELARLAIEQLFWRMRNGPDSPQVVMTVAPRPNVAELSTSSDESSL